MNTLHFRLSSIFYLIIVMNHKPAYSALYLEIKKQSCSNLFSQTFMSAIHLYPNCKDLLCSMLKLC